MDKNNQSAFTCFIKNIRIHIKFEAVIIGLQYPLDCLSSFVNGWKLCSFAVCLVAYLFFLQ